MEKWPDKILHKKITQLIEKSLEKSVFSACSVGYFIKVKDEDSFEGDILNYGLAGGGAGTFKIDAGTYFDLASLTKPLVTSLCVLALMQEGKLHIDDKLCQFFTTSEPDHRNCTLFNLLTHSSGLPAHRPYFKKLIHFPHYQRMDKVVDWIMEEKFLFQPGTETLYSDLGFILLGKIIEKVSGESLDDYWQSKIIMPMDLNKGLFFANQKKIGSEVYAATGECGWSKTKLYGTVHDDNCRALGGVAGHAGLFGTAAAVLALCENLVLQYRGYSRHPYYSSENLKKVLNTKKGSWRFGFDTPSTAFSSSGKYFSEMSIGHLGFTGTSFWIDLQRGIALVFLTNRVSCGENAAAIKKLRPLVHDTIMAALIKKSG